MEGDGELWMKIHKWFCLGFCLFVAQKKNLINEGMKKELKKIESFVCLLSFKEKKAKFVELLTAQKLSLRAFQSFYIFIFFVI